MNVIKDPMKTILLATLATVGLGCAALLFLGWRAQEPMEIAGQVFIVRNDHETVRMSGVEVLAGRSGILSNEVNVIRGGILAMDIQTDLRLKKALLEMTDAESTKEAAHNAWNRKRDARIGIENAITESGQSMGFMREADRLVAAEKNRERAVKLSSVFADQQNLYAAWQRADSAEKAARRELEEARTGRRDWKKRRIAMLMSPGLHGRTTAMTDADGRFRISVPKRGDSTLVIRAERMIFGGVKEYYLWAEPVRGTNVLLSNANLALNFRVDEEKREAEGTLLPGFESESTE